MTIGDALTKVYTILVTLFATGVASVAYVSCYVAMMEIILISVCGRK